MDYTKHYWKLIEKRRLNLPEGYSERHHITPRCMGGTDELENLVDLTPEEHFLAHVLLVKMFPERRELVFSVNQMCLPVAGRPSRKLVGWLRRRFARAMSETQMGINNSQYGSRWYHNEHGARKFAKNEEIPVGYFPGRKPKKKQIEKVRKSGVTYEQALRMYEEFLRGKKLEEIARDYNLGHKQTLTKIFNRYIPDRKKFSPRECRQSIDGDAPAL